MKLSDLNPCAICGGPLPPILLADVAEGLG